MINPHTYFETVRERFQTMTYQPCIKRDPHKKGQSTYFVAAPIFRTTDSGPLFIPLDLIWDRLHEQDQIFKDNTLQAAELLDVERLQLCMIEEAFDCDKEGRLCATTEGRLFKYCKIDPPPPFHDYDNLGAYTWEKPNDTNDKVSFAIYEADCFLYWVLKSPLTYRLFFSQLLDCIATACGYTEKEKTQFQQDLTRLHRTIINREINIVHQ